MKVSVIGCGYLGAVHAATMASLGHTVVGLEPDATKVWALAQGLPPFHEPGLQELVQEGLISGRLEFTTEPSAVAGSSVHFICVGTPQAKTAMDADLSQILAAIDALLPYLHPGDVVAGKSTVPVGTSELVSRRLEGSGAFLAWNPEFLRQGSAVSDSLHPERIVYGLPSGGNRSRIQTVLDTVYAPLLDGGTPRIVTDWATAELIKSAANAFLAMKLSYINAVGELCEQVGADVVGLSLALGLDGRIGADYLKAGVGFGGGCLPKDLRSFRVQAKDHGVDSLEELLSLVDGINADARYRAGESALRMCGGSVVGRRIGVLGAAFKADTDDVRDSPALDIALQLAAEGAQVTVSDPRVPEHTWLAYPQLSFVRHAEQALRGAELAMLLTPWPEFVGLDPAETALLMSVPRMYDGRNALDPVAWKTAGWEYYGAGRGMALGSVQAAH
ncbi:UDP-glucose dehydrogenase family protein [Arthrobacter cryoconiti]|uniref:UDP-glucose 6-dehydrogenase n=1 Tax=Arthrobacter cryoconiti TaxID=748907 RepID=A0ABV8QZX8_9MICC|nr:UDP-glucose/GDP-mannose dehydrogenase family protein [Arthrobacter cryoconiti]MCC9068544.1 UDP-glucose/GDP-mannose dehydrogenase family protein [Arthrobacter cryoconiti]